MKKNLDCAGVTQAVVINVTIQFGRSHKRISHIDLGYFEF